MPFVYSKTDFIIIFYYSFPSKTFLSALSEMRILRENKTPAAPNPIRKKKLNKYKSKTEKYAKHSEARRQTDKGIQKTRRRKKSLNRQIKE